MSVLICFPFQADAACARLMGRDLHGYARRSADAGGMAMRFPHLRHGRVIRGSLAGGEPVAATEMNQVPILGMGSDCPSACRQR